MDPVLSQALAALITAASTVLLLAGSYYFGPNRADRKWVRKTRERKEDSDEGAAYRADEDWARESRIHEEDEAG